MRALSFSQRRQIEGIKGIISSLGETELAQQQCPLLAAQLEEIKIMALALAIMAAKIDVRVEE